MIQELQQKYGNDNVYFGDQTGCDKYFHRKSGYAKKGIKIHKEISGLRYKRLSIISLCNYQNKLVFPIIYEDTADSTLVYWYFETQVLPFIDENSVVILDNARIHKSPKLKELFEKYNCHLKFLSPYSPDLNPTENIWGNVKQDLCNYYNHTLTLIDNICQSVNKYSLMVD